MWRGIGWWTGGETRPGGGKKKERTARGTKTKGNENKRRSFDDEQLAYPTTLRCSLFRFASLARLSHASPPSDPSPPPPTPTIRTKNHTIAKQNHATKSTSHASYYYYCASPSPSPSPLDVGHVQPPPLASLHLPHQPVVVRNAHGALPHPPVQLQDDGEALLEKRRER